MPQLSLVIDAKNDQQAHIMLSEASAIRDYAFEHARGHMTTSRYYGGLNWVIGVLNVILAAAVGASQLQDLSLSKLTVGLMGISVAVLTAIMGFLKADTHAKEHLNAGNKFKSIGDDVDFFIRIDSYDSEDNRRTAIKSFKDRLDDPEINNTLIPWWAELLAQINLTRRQNN